MRVLLLSAYAAQSHRQWQEALRAMLPDWHWSELNLPPRHFSWRVRGNPLVWSQSQRAELLADYDLLVATSMVDLATLRGLVPALANLPTALYFHENQFAYPAGQHKHGLLEAQMVSLYAALAADRLLFNSAYNRDSFLEGLSALLARLPDQVPDGICEQLLDKAEVLSVPLPVATQVPSASLKWPGKGGAYPQRPLRLLWSARFEHDKGGEGLLRVLEQLALDGLDFELALTGQQFRQSPPVFAEIARRFAPQLVQYGYVESPLAYAALRREADLVLSTALHEFQGLAVLQAVADGCLPVVPDRLAYREIYPASLRYCSSPEQPEREARAAADLVGELAASLSHGGHPGVDVQHYGQAALGPRYRSLFESLAAPG